MDLKRILNVLWDYALVTLGCVIFCMAWTSFMIPNNIASGGIAGLSTIIQFATMGAIPVSVSYIVLNVFLLALGFLVLGKGFGFKTIYAILLSTILFKIMPGIDIILALPGHPLFIEEKVLIPVIAGLVEAVGIFIIFNRGGSTGGTDVIALILNKFYPVSPGKVYMVLDLFIIASVLLVPGKTFQDMIYGYLAMITFSMMLDFFLLGSKSTMQVMVFSKHYDKIADYIMNDLKRGVTALNSVGWYTKNDSKVLLILVRKPQIQELTKAIKKIDSKAFVSVSAVSSVYGQGFDEMKTGIERKKKTVGSLNQ